MNQYNVVFKPNCIVETLFSKEVGIQLNSIFKVLIMFKISRYASLFIEFK